MNYEKKELNPEEFRRMQLVQLELLVDFDRVCRKHNIGYVISSGTMLGAVRHKGYIPWDDDADIMMLREDYERFKTVMNDLNPQICYFQDHTTDPGYRWGYGKLRRTGTEYVRVGQEHLKCKTGIFVDVFPYDDIPNSTIGQVLQDAFCFCCRKILWSEVGKKVCTGFWKYWFWLLSHIPTKTVFKWLSYYTKKSRNSSANRVRILCFTSIGKLYYKHPLHERYGVLKEWFTDRAEYVFEGKKLMGTKDYDTCLRYWYGDYMKLPPEDKREQHSACSYIDFGECGLTTSKQLENCDIQQLSPNDGEEMYNLLQHIDEEENAFKNPVKRMSFDEYKKWLVQQDKWSRNEDLPDGFVAQTCFWLMVNNNPVAIGKIRHALTDNSRSKGGNLGYAVSSEYRGKGYGTKILQLLVNKANEMGIKEKILTVEKCNPASKRVIEKNGGILYKENEERWYFKIL